MKSNPYVYPSTDFMDLSNKKFKAVFSPNEYVTTENLKNLLSSLDSPELQITGKSIEQRVLNIFTDNEILFGPKKYITNNTDYWLKAIRYFVKQNKPLQLTILGFPFKMPVPIKTNRSLPDMGEVLSLKRLHYITELIGAVYNPGAVITVVTEGVFGRFNNMKKSEYNAYKNFLNEIIKTFYWTDTLKIIELEKMEKMTDNFVDLFEKKVNKLKKLYEVKDKEFLKKYNGAKLSISRIINTRDLNISNLLLMDVYNTKLKMSEVTPEVLKIRKHIEIMTYETLLRYHAYLMVRDDLNFIEKTVPHAITLSVSPKPNRLGIIPVNKNCIRLPYHGVPVYHENKNIFTIEYLIDLMRKKGEFKKVYWNEDKEKYPFYYITK